MNTSINQNSNGASEKKNIINNAVSQLMLIVLLFELFFVVAKGSSLYYTWEQRIQELVSTGCVVFGILFLALFVTALVPAIKNKRWKNSSCDIIGLGLMIIIHYLVRAGMVETIQLDEGLTYYKELRALSYNPELLLEDFINAGKLVDRTAYGYLLFALTGEFLMPGTGYGFQWIQMFMGIAAACCLYELFKKIFPEVKRSVAWLAAFVVSVQPMFLGLSTTCGLEYSLVIFFIYALYACVNKRYILMVFWLIMLGTTKSIGLIMALTFVCSYMLAMLVSRTDIKQKKPSGSTGIYIGVAMAVLAVLIYVIVRICIINDIYLNFEYIKLKTAHLYMLNMAWVWVIIIGFGLGMVLFNVRVRRTHTIQFVPLFILITCYLVYVAYLMAFDKAILPKNDMLADVILAMFAVFLLIKMFERYNVIMYTLGIIGLIMYMQAFVNIDPVSAKFFTTIETNSFPMMYTASFKSEKDIQQDNATDYGYYNYQYTFVDKAIDDALWHFDWYGTAKIVSAYEGCETQLFYDDLRWDLVEAKRAYPVGLRDDERYQYIGRSNVETLLMGSSLPERLLFIDSPWCSGDTEADLEILSQYYEIDGPRLSKQGFAGSIIYYFLELK